MSSDRASQLVEAGIWLKLSGDREGARKLFERALKLDPGNQKATQLLAGAPAPGEDTAPPAASSKTPSPPSIASSIGTNPFERPDRRTQVEWGPSTQPLPEADLEGDWGRLTGAATPVPQPMPASSGEDPGPYTASSSSNVVLGNNSPVPKSTLLFPAAKGAAPRTTLQLFGPDDEEVPVAPRTIELGGDAGPDAPPSSTPPLFGSGPAEPAPMTVTFGALPTPSPSTPPLFASLPAAAPAPVRPEPMGQAWAWASSSPPPQEQRTVEEEFTPVPRPSPSLAPRAESAWDQRSNPGIKLEAVVGRDRALDLISADSKASPAPPSRKEEIRTILRGARDLLDLDDHSGAMELIVKAQEIAPDDPEVLLMRERSEKTLLAMFESKLGKPDTIPRVLLKDDEIIWLNLDHRAGFVLAQIDGTVSFDDLFSVSGMSRIDTARILAQLVEEGVISRG
ncbi:MAG: hypothetical protein Q8K32_08505 [Archangium sp.]|nr:hypothetical protein [Archangium sp.]